jgi:hypothetical protein
MKNKFNDKHKQELDNVNSYYQEYQNLLNQKQDIKVLEKYKEMNDFFLETNGSLQAITNDLSLNKNKLSNNIDIRPLTVIIEKAIEMIKNYRMEPPKGDRVYNTNQIQSQGKSVIHELYSNEDRANILPPLDATKKSTMDSVQQHPQAEVNFSKPVSVVTAQDNTDRLWSYSKMGSSTRKRDTPVFEITQNDEPVYKTKFEKIKYDRKQDNNYVAPYIILPEEPLDPITQEVSLEFVDKNEVIEEAKTPVRNNQEEASVLKNLHNSISTVNQTNLALINTISHDNPIHNESESRNLHSNLLKNASTVTRAKGEPVNIYCWGDAPFQLEYDISADRWSAKPYYTNSVEELRGEPNYKGNLKYSTICNIGSNGDYLLSGGWDVTKNEAVREAYMFRLSNTRQMLQMASMKLPRYGHWSVYCNGYVFVIGGFAMDDSIDIEPITLTSWEKFHYKENMWTEAAGINTSRAYAGVVWFQNKLRKNNINSSMIPSNSYIYVFGGLSDLNALDSIEKYDATLDVWIQLKLVIPIKIAKLGVSTLDSSSILICGGIFANEMEEFDYISNAYKLDFMTEKWIKLPNMSYKRVLYSVMPRIKDRVYAIGGSFEGHCEYFDINTQKWIGVSGYSEILPDNDVQTFWLINSYR